MRAGAGAGAAAGCEHGAGSHDGTEPSGASAPEASRAWLLIEHPGPWPAEAERARLPPLLRDAVRAAVPLGIRVQLIRRPGRRRTAAGSEAASVFVGWTAGRDPWLRRATAAAADQLSAGALGELAAGRAPDFGAPAGEPQFLVCTHGRRDMCCARFGVPLARALAPRYPRRVWETTHVGGHRYAANLVILPHGLYYGPVDAHLATLAISAYERGEVAPDRYRGRAGQARSGGPP